MAAYAFLEFVKILFLESKLRLKIKNTAQFVTFSSTFWLSNWNHMNHQAIKNTLTQKSSLLKFSRV